MVARADASTFNKTTPLKRRQGSSNRLPQSFPRQGLGELNNARIPPRVRPQELQERPLVMRKSTAHWSIYTPFLCVTVAICNA